MHETSAYVTNTYLTRIAELTKENTLLGVATEDFAWESPNSPAFEPQITSREVSLRIFRAWEQSLIATIQRKIQTHDVHYVARVSLKPIALMCVECKAAHAAGSDKNGIICTDCRKKKETARNGEQPRKRARGQHAA